MAATVLGELLEPNQLQRVHNFAPRRCMPAVSTALKLQTMLEEEGPRDADKTFTPAQSLCHALSSHEVLEMQT